LSKTKKSVYLSRPSAPAALPAPAVVRTTARVLLHEERRLALAENKEKEKEEMKARAGRWR
jgi:hypothetical protein